MLKRNRLRELLREGKPTLGTHVICPWPGMIEVIGQTGVFDYIEYVGEYSSFSLEQLDNVGRTLELFPNMSSMMKVEEQTRGFIAQRSIDAGFQSVLFTDCRSADDVTDCINLVRAEMPGTGGIHGCGMRRDCGYLYGGGADWVKRMEDVVIAVMIEKKGAVDNLEEILSLKGVDMVQFGPADYSISIGKPGERGCREVQKAQADMIRLALKKGVAPRVELVSFEQAPPYWEMGVRHFCVGWDLITICNWCLEQARGMATMVTSETSRLSEPGA